MISLLPVTADNWKACANLAISEAQKGFIPDNLSSIAEAQFYPKSRSRAIYAGSDLVDYSLYGVDDAVGHWKVFRLMIAEGFQGRGYGRATMKVILEEIKFEGAKVVLIKFHQENKVAKHLYEKLGFKEFERADTHVTAQCLLD